MKRRFLAAFAALMLIAVVMPAATAITNGQEDTDELFPAVGQLLFYDASYPDSRFTDPGGWFTCTGTLLSPTVVLTAGHCTWGIGEGGAPNADGREGTDVWVNFEQAPDYTGIASGPYIPDNAARYAGWSAVLNASSDWYRGTAYPHPQYDDAAFLLYDAGVVVLDEPVPASVHEDDFGELPALGHLDQYFPKKGQKQSFTPVGYGIQEIKPNFVSYDLRYFASIKLIDATGVYGVPAGVAVKFSNNQGKPYTGGTCFGDSGGPVFEGDSRRVVAVTSFGINGNCKGTGGGYRIDQADDLTFINGFLNP